MIYLIEFRNVSKKYSKGIEALKDVSFTINDGDFVFVIGPSGAGKTSIIKLLLKEENPTSGKIFLDGKEISFLPARRIPAIRRSTGVVFQDFRLLEDRNVYDNVKFAVDINGVSSKTTKERVKKVLGLVGLEARSKNYPLQLSGGEQQRVSLARAMVNEPKILIADEPTGNLDPATADEIVSLLKKINENGTTIIMVTHSKEIVNSMGKRVLQFADGELVRDEEHGRYL